MSDQQDAGGEVPARALGQELKLGSLSIPSKMAVPVASAVCVFFVLSWAAHLLRPELLPWATRTSAAAIESRITTVVIEHLERKIEDMRCACGGPHPVPVPPPVNTITFLAAVVGGNPGSSGRVTVEFRDADQRGLSAQEVFSVDIHDNKGIAISQLPVTVQVPQDVHHARVYLQPDKWAEVPLRRGEGTIPQLSTSGSLTLRLLQYEIR